MKKKIAVALLSLFLLCGIAFFTMRDWAFRKLVNSLLTNKVELVEPGEVEPDKTLFLDARSRAEYDVSHLPGAIWVGYEDFDIARVPEDKNRNVTVYCSLGKRSEDIGIKLQEAGYRQVKNMYGGIFQWVNEGRGVEDSNGVTNKVHGYSRSWGIWLKQGEKVYN